MIPFGGCFGANDFYEQSVSVAFGGATMFMTNKKEGIMSSDETLIKVFQKAK